VAVERERQGGWETEQRNEDMIELLAHGMMQVVQDNPWLASITYWRNLVGGGDGGENAG